LRGKRRDGEWDGAVLDNSLTFWVADPNTIDEPVPQWESRANQPGFVVSTHFTTVPASGTY